jgi:hypothetical protein
MAFHPPVLTVEIVSIEVSNHCHYYEEHVMCCDIGVDEEM